VMVEAPDEFADAVNQFLLGPRTHAVGYDRYEIAASRSLPAS
jgi:hypothetical protein